MKDFKQASGSDHSESPRFNHHRGPRSSERFHRPVMHSAVCSSCGQACTVPFKPNGRQPVYCNVCFGNSRLGRERQQMNIQPDRSQYLLSEECKQQLAMLNTKLDHILKLLTARNTTEETSQATDQEQDTKVVKVVTPKRVAKTTKVSKAKSKK